MNSVQIIGTIGRKPELKIVGNNTSLCDFSVAIKDERREYTSWINVVAFGAVAQRAETLDKGNRVFIAGRLQEDRWEKDGKKHSRMKVIADLVAKQEYADERPNPEQSTSEQKPSQSHQPLNDPQGIIDNDDLPF